MTDATVAWIICVSAPNPLAVSVFSPSQADFNRKIAGTLNSVATQIGTGNVGDIKSIAGPTLPQNWLYCDGSEVNRRGFPELFAELGEKWGAGNGADTFNLPDLRATGPVAATTVPATTVSGGGVTVDGSIPASGATGGTSGNTTTGGRPPSLNRYSGGITPDIP